MDGDSGFRPAPDQAADPLDHLGRLDDDQREGPRVGFPDRGFDASTAAGVVVSLLMSGVLARGIGPPTEMLFTLAVLDVFLPCYAVGRALHATTGSWRGTPAARPSTSELLLAGTSYVVALAVVLTSAHLRWWVLVLGASAACGEVWLRLCRRWLARYRQEPHDRPLSWSRLRVVVVAVLGLGTNLALAYAVAALGLL